MAPEAIRLTTARWQEELREQDPLVEEMLSEQLYDAVCRRIGIATRGSSATTANGFREIYRRITHVTIDGVTYALRHSHTNIMLERLALADRFAALAEQVAVCPTRRENGFFDLRMELDGRLRHGDTFPDHEFPVQLFDATSWCRAFNRDRVNVIVFADGSVAAGFPLGTRTCWRGFQDIPAADRYLKAEAEDLAAAAA